MKNAAKTFIRAHGLNIKDVMKMQDLKKCCIFCVEATKYADGEEADRVRDIRRSIKGMNQCRKTLQYLFLMQLIG